MPGYGASRHRPSATPGRAASRLRCRQLAPLAWWVWVPVTLAQMGWLAVVAACATSGHYCMTRAFRAAPMTVTQPVTFLSLIWATLVGALVFGEAVDIFVLLGGAMIIGAITFVTWFEATGRDAAALPE